MKKTRDCRDCEIPRYFYRMLDKELPPEKAEELKQYLAKYEECAQHFENEKEIRQCLKEKIKSAQLSADLKNRILKNLPAD